jgi:hypothetical protein
VNSTCVDSRVNLDIREVLVPRGGGTERLAIVLEARRTIKASETLWTQYALGVGVECRCGLPGCSGKAGAEGHGGTSPPPVKARRTVESSKKEIRTWYEERKGMSLLDAGPGEVARWACEIMDAVIHIRAKSSQDLKGTVKDGVGLFEIMRSALVDADQLEQCSEAHQIVLATRDGGMDPRLRVQHLSAAMEDIEESDSPSRLAQVVLAAEMVRVYRQDTSLPLDSFRQEQLDVIGGGDLDDTAKGIQRVERLLDAGCILPPGEPPGVERETLVGWGTLEPLAMQIRWWQRGLLRPLDDLEEA